MPHWHESPAGGLYRRARLCRPGHDWRSPVLHHRHFAPVLRFKAGALAVSLGLMLASCGGGTSGLPGFDGSTSTEPAAPSGETIGTGKVKVEGAMVVKRHVKPMPQMNREGGIKEREAWVDISNVAIVDPDTGKPTKVRYETRDGKKVRIAQSGKEIPDAGNYMREKKKKVDGDEEAQAEEDNK